MTLDNLLTRSREFNQMMGHIAALQQHVDTLYSNLSALRSQVDANMGNIMPSPYPNAPFSQPLSTSPSVPMLGQPPTTPKQKHPTFHGPTSSAFSLGLAKSRLQTMGITGTEDGLEDGMAPQDETPNASPPHARTESTQLHASKDPIWSISKEEAIRLIHVWQDEMGGMYPVIEIDKTLRHTNLLFTFMDAARRTGLMAGGAPGADAIYDDQTIMLKLVLAVALTLEGSGKSELGKRLFETTRESVEVQVFAPASIKTIRMLCLAVRKRPPKIRPSTDISGNVPISSRRGKHCLEKHRPRCKALH